MKRGVTFAAIDSETANNSHASACAVGVVKVRGRKVLEEFYRLIRPPQQRFTFTYLHGISWEDVADEPNFRGVWTALRPILRDVDFLAAHNASFDRSVILSCCRAGKLRPPPQVFHCTMQIARREFGIYPTGLNNVCRKLRIPLRHHNALSDAHACARIVMMALQKGAL